MLIKPQVRFILLVGLFAVVSLTLGCMSNVPRFGVGGRYEEGRDQFLRGRGGDMDKAVAALEYVVSQDPTYKSSLMYLGRAYYRKNRYQDAFAILQRALAVDKEDEQAWLALGVTQLRLGQTDKGIETMKGAITLTSKVMVEGYHTYEFWDSRGLIKASIRQVAFQLTKGASERDNIMRSTDRLFALIDDEENFQKNSHIQNVRPQYQ